MENPAEVNRALLKFLESIDPLEVPSA
jgi:hypothetical protein